MKKLFLTSIALIFVTALFAQEGTTNLGFNVGFAEPVMYYRASSSATKLTRQATDGIKLGVIYETNIIKGFGVSSSLNYTHSTHIGPWTVTPGFAARKTKEDHNFHQLEIPVDWQYKFVIAKYTYLGLYTGPTLQVGLANTFRYRTKVGDEIIEDRKEDVYKIDEDHDGKPDYNRVNVTWGVGAVFQYKRYFIRGGYDFGIMPIYKDNFFNTGSETGWNRKGRLDQWQIKLGIYFWQFD